ncbi:MAG TPA: DUF4255 domain-containing protein [Pseudonocardiaceae bacterium]|nr:DUF4255 domain-containing protein [Pseudonocardiaceae bacterium]
MFNEVDEALRALVRAEAVNPADVDVVFDAPTKEWSSRRNAPAVNLYLYDIREDMRRRERGLINSYDERGRVVSRRQPPRHFKVSYLITAWTQRPEDEHRLLSALLYCFLRNETLPTELLSGQLVEVGLPVTLSVALPPPEDRAFADVWSALGGELKPSLDLVVTAPVDGGRPFPAGPPVQDPLTIDFGGLAEQQRDQPRRKTRQPAARNGGSAPGDSTGPGDSERTGDSEQATPPKRTVRTRRSTRGRGPTAGTGDG